MKKNKFQYFLPVTFVALFLGFYLSFLFLSAASAGTGTYLAINASSAGSDNLIGENNANWLITVTTTAELVRGDVLQIHLPTLTDVELFSSANATTTALTNIAFYTSLISETPNILTNSSFEGSTTGWAGTVFTPSYSGGEPTTWVIDTTSTAYDGSSAVYFSATSTNKKFIQQNISMSTGTEFTASLYGKGATGSNESVDLMITANDISCGSEAYAYNFTTESWGCASRATFVNSDSDYFESFDMTTSFARSTKTLTAPTTSTYNGVLTVYVGVGGTDIDRDELVVVDAIQVEVASSATTYMASNTGSDTLGIGSGQSDTVIYGFVSSTITSSTTFNMNIGGIKNGAGSITDMTDLTWTVKAGTPDDSDDPSGSLSNKYSKTSNTTLIRLGNVMTTDSNFDVSASTSTASATGTTYTFVFTATSSLASGSKIALNFPSGYDLSSATTSLQSNINASSGTAAGSNILTDDGLETWSDSSTLTNWTLLTGGAGATLAREGSATHGGTYAALLTSAVDTTPSIIEQLQTGKVEGTTYHVTYWAKYNNSTSTSQVLIFNDTMGSATQIFKFSGASSPSWQPYTGSEHTNSDYASSESSLTDSYVQYTTDDFTVPASGKLGIVIGTGGGVNNTIYIDDLSLNTPAVGASPVQIASGAIATSTSYSRNQAVLTTSNATASAGDVITLTVAGVTNPSTIGDYDSFYVYATDSDDGLVDGSYIASDYGSTPYMDTVTIIAIPTQVTGLTATAASISQINLAWTAVDGASYYSVYGSADSYATAIATTTEITYSATGLSTATTYSYKVSATNSLGEGTVSSVASATTESAAVVSSGGGGSAPAIVSSGNAGTTITVGMNAFKNIGILNADGVNLISYIGSKVEMKINGEMHALEVISVNMTTGEITLKLQSETIEVDLKEGDTKKIDLNGDGTNNIKLVYNDLVRNRVDLSLFAYEQELKNEDGEEVEEKEEVKAPSTPIKPATTVKYIFKNYLGIGSSGDEVLKLQQVLEDLGYFTYSAGPTGYFGNVTKTAVVKFQKAKNLSPFPGFVGPGTRKALNESYGEVVVKEEKKTDVKYTFTSYLYLNNSGDEVLKLQQVLEDLGYFTYSAGPTGYYGNITKQAVTAYQKAKNLSPFPGWVGPGTRKALNSL